MHQGGQLQFRSRPPDPWRLGSLLDASRLLLCPVLSLSVSLPLSSPTTVVVYTLFVTLQETQYFIMQASTSHAGRSRFSLVPRFGPLRRCKLQLRGALAFEGFGFGGVVQSCVAPINFSTTTTCDLRSVGADRNVLVELRISRLGPGTSACPEHNSKPLCNKVTRMLLKVPGDG